MKRRVSSRCVVRFMVLLQLVKTINFTLIPTYPHLVSHLRSTHLNHDFIFAPAGRLSPTSPIKTAQTETVSYSQIHNSLSMNNALTYAGLGCLKKHRDISAGVKLKVGENILFVSYQWGCAPWPRTPLQGARYQHCHLGTGRSGGRREGRSLLRADRGGGWEEGRAGAD